MVKTLFMATVRFTLAVFFVAMLLTGCNPKVMPAQPHPPASPHQIELYQAQPPKYELLGTVTVPSDLDTVWDKHGNANGLFDEMKRQAAQLGANGLMLLPLKHQIQSRISAGYRGEFYFVPMKGGKSPAAIAQAISVVTE